MIIIPEIETVVLLVPRTASASLRRAIMARYPKAMQIYRHMEADGIPLGYDRWSRIGIVRHPVERLWSLYKFLRDFGGQTSPDAIRINGAHDPAYVAAMRGSVAQPFDAWLTSNEVVFTSPYDRAGLNRYWPGFTVRHPLPENRKSQWMTLRPDLGTEIFKYDRMRDIEMRLKVVLAVGHNKTDESSAPALSRQADEYVTRVFAWDFGTAGVDL